MLVPIIIKVHLVSLIVNLLIICVILNQSVSGLSDYYQAISFSLLRRRTATHSRCATSGPYQR